MKDEGNKSFIVTKYTLIILPVIFWINKNNDDINIINKEIDKFSNSSDKDLLVLVRSIKNKFL